MSLEKLIRVTLHFQHFLMSSSQELQHRRLVGGNTFFPALRRQASIYAHTTGRNGT